MAVKDLQMTVSPGAIDCAGSAVLELCLDRDSPMQQVPADMVLVLDRSGSMYGKRMQKMMRAAGCLLEILAKTSGDDTGRTILGGSRLGLISFSGEARVEAELETRVEKLRAAVEKLEAQGDTNHQRAFRAAGKLLEGSTARRQVVILFTDGISNLGDPDPAAAELRHRGIEIYCIGLLSNPCLLYDWASCPKEEHVAVACNPNDLEQAFCSIAHLAAGSGGDRGWVELELCRDFRILQIEKSGTVESGPGWLRWEPGPGKQRLRVEILHIGREGGCKQVTKKAVYRDSRGCCLNFPPVCLQVDCDCGSLITEPCPSGCCCDLERCQETAVCRCEDLCLEGLGRIVEVGGVIRNVCPGKRVAVAVMLTERDPDGREYPRGTKTLLIPAQEGEGCRDVTVRCIKFAVPEALAPWNCQQSICDERFFKVRMFAHYVDSDYTCCDGEAWLP